MGLFLKNRMWSCSLLIGCAPRAWLASAALRARPVIDRRQRMGMNGVNYGHRERGQPASGFEMRSKKFEALDATGSVLMVVFGRLRVGTSR
jgi:hypothetical protein